MTSIHAMFAPSNLVQNKGIGNRQSDPLSRLLTQVIERAGQPARIERATSRPWNSALFQGRRHVILLHIGGASAAARRAHFTQGLGEVEWTLPGHFVADIVVDDHRADADGEWLDLSALTIEDW